MRVHIASDHAGFALKESLREHLRTLGYEVVDHGPQALDPDDDYPITIRPVAFAVAENPGDVGIVLGKSGQGEAMVCNRVKGVRAAVYYGGPTEILALSREHNGANALSLGAGFVTEEEAKKAVELWFSTPLGTDERHLRRQKLLDL